MHDNVLLCNSTNIPFLYPIGIVIERLELFEMVR
jgi:hypothetical protein